MLVGSSIRRCEADLCEGVLEADPLRCLCVAQVGLEVPAGLLPDLADDETT